MARLRIVMCAGIVPSELHGEIGKTFSGLIPVAGKCMLQSHIAFVRPSEHTLIFTVDEKDARSQRYLDLLQTEYVITRGSSSIGEALLSALQLYSAKLKAYESIEVIFGDTLSTQPLPLDAIAVVSVPDATEWTQVIREEQGLRFTSGVSTRIDTVAGYFSFSQPELLRDILAEAPDFWCALSTYDTDVQSLSIVELKSWSDFGRIDTLFKSRQLDFNARHFNTIQYIPESGSIRKSSSPDKRDKILAEASWFQSLTEEQKVLTPAFKGIDFEHGTYELEYLPTPTMSEMMLFGKMQIGYWERFFEELSSFLIILHRKPSEDIDTQTRYDAMQYMYVTKIESRFEELNSSNLRLPELSYEIDGRACMSLQEGFERLLEWGRNQIARDFHFIHGDLFLGNLFFDRRMGLIRAIDPRGTFGVLYGQGDRRYDLGKLSHSLNGGYDLLAADLFNVSVTGDKAFVRTAIATLHSPSQTLKDEALARYCFEANVDMFDVRMIEAGLFLSMASLHSESPNRQMALIATGLRVLDELDRKS